MSFGTSRDQGSGIPRWLTVVNVVAIVVTLAVVIPRQVRAAVAAAPSGTTVCGRVSPTAPKLCWQDADTLAQGFILQRAPDSTFDSGVVEFRIARSTFDYIDETETYAKTFWYRVYAVTGNQRSDAGNVVPALNGKETRPGTHPGPRPAAPAAPGNVHLEQQGSGMRITWDDPATNESAEWVERSGDYGTTWEFRASLSLNSTSYFDGDPPSAAPTYRIWTFNGGGLRTSEQVTFGGANAPTGAASATSAASNAAGLASNATAVASAAGPIASNATNVASATALASQVLPLATGLASQAGPLASTATNLASVLNPGAIQSTLNGIASATAIASLVNPAAIQSSVNGIASGATAVASATNTVSAVASSVPDVNKLGVWFGIRINSPGQPPIPVVAAWLWPPSCFSTSPNGQGGPCKPPKSPVCSPIIAPYEYCTYIDTDGSR